MTSIARLYLITVSSILIIYSSSAQNSRGIDPEALIERILSVDSAQTILLSDVIFDTELLEGEMKKDGFKQKERFIKKVFIKYLKDTTLYRQEIIEYYKDGKLQSDKERDKKIDEKEKAKKKRGSRDAAFRMLKPFYPQYRQLYDIEYVGVATVQIDNYVCHEFQVTSKEKSDSLINATYYFEADGFNLVRCNFSPSKLPGGMMFKLKQLDMQITYTPTPKGIWLPNNFEVIGKGKAAFFFGVNFAAHEYYRNPIVNPGLDEKSFFKTTDQD